MPFKAGGQIYVDGPTAACPFEGCGLRAHVQITSRGCELVGGCRHIISIERVGKKIVLVYVDDEVE